MNYKIIQKTCEDMSFVGDNSVACIFTSPPYALAKDYGDTSGIGMSKEVDAYTDYINRMLKVFKECYRVLQPGRFIGVNIADVIQTEGTYSVKKPISIHMFLLLKKVGFSYKETIIWKKPSGMSSQKRFGVFIQHPYPTYYHPNNMFEPILVFKKPGKFILSDDDKRFNKLDYKMFTKYQTDIWEICPESGVEHPAPFPVKLPQLFIELHSLKGETILDPFLGCYDEQTEVLTNNGWKYFKDLTFDDKICQLDKGSIIYDAPLDIMKYDYNGNMISFDSRGLNLLVTPNHKILMRTNKWGNYRIERAESINYKQIFTKSKAIWKGIYKDSFNINNRIIPSLLWLKFIAIYLAEGSTGKGCVNICQTKEPTRTEFYNVCKNIADIFNRKCTIIGKDIKIYSTDLTTILSKYGKCDKKYVPYYIKELSSELIDVFLKWIVKGDGSICKGYVSYFTTSKKLADDIQELCLKTNKSASIGFDHKDRIGKPVWIKNHYTKSTKVCYRVGFRIASEQKTFKKSISKVLYEGKVYCATVKTGLMYIRRNGKPVWCGNSGTTMLAARNVGRECIGYEINPEYVKLCFKRCNFPQNNQSDMSSYGIKSSDKLEVLYESLEETKKIT